MNRQKQASFWYIGLFLGSVAVIFADAPLLRKVQHTVSRTYESHWHILYLMGVFSLFALLLLGKSSVNAAKLRTLNGVCLAISLLLTAAVFLPGLPWLPGSNSVAFLAMLTTSCAADLVQSFRQKEH